MSCALPWSGQKEFCWRTEFTTWKGAKSQGDKDGPYPQNSGSNSSNHIPELGYSQRRKMRASNARMVSSSPYSHHPKKDFFILSLLFLNKKCQENPNLSILEGWARRSWCPEAHLAPGCSQHLPGQGAHGISRARQIPAFPSQDFPSF